MEIVSLQNARVNGLLKYFTGKPCKRGHVCERDVKYRSCPECNKITDKKWAKNNREKCCQYAKKWRKRNPEKARDTCMKWKKNNPGENARIKKEWRKKNPERQKYLSTKNFRDWKNKNPDRWFEFVKKWRRTNAEKVTASLQRRRALKRGAEGFFTANDIKNMAVCQNNMCAYCGKEMIKKGDRTIDHKTPLIRGGSNWPDNIHLTCFSCNTSKGSKTHEEYLYVTQKNNRRLK